MSENFIEEAKKNWHAPAGLQPDTQQLIFGALQRIANASEKMAASYTSLQNDRDLYKRWYNEERETVARLQKANAALRGHLNRLKKQIAS